ncbi:MAG: cytochrome c biogenesis protein ResB [Proteobacteria bacterium]|nr:cytochrome c biogenesis protein ResB [Pseudomonadota bacterium]
MLKKTLTLIDSILKSPKYAIIFMISIGVISIYGTIFPAKTPYDFNLYKTPLYIGLLIILSINIAYCTYFRIIKVFFALQRGKFGQERIYTVRKDILELFTNRGFKIKKVDGGYLVFKGLLRTYAILTLHILIISFILTAGLSSYLGFLGTVNVHEKRGTDICFDWNEKKDVVLPFYIFVNATKIEYYPMPLKIEIEDLKNSNKREFVTKEGDIINYDGLKLRILKGIIEKRSIIFTLIDNNLEVGPFENEYSGKDNAFKIKFLAYIDPLPKQFYADLTINDRDGNTTNKIISINNPLNFKGYKVYLVDINRDEFGFPYVGLQITYEPLLTIIWVLCFLIVLTLFVYPFVDEVFVKLRENEMGFDVYIWKEKRNFYLIEKIKSYEIV